jgi:hypothetical protein
MLHQTLVIAALTLFLTSCTPIGPKTVPRDRSDYNTAIANSWKEQTLLNIVKIRYADMPLFVEVASIISGYTLEGSVNLGGNVSSSNALQGDFFSVGAGGKFIDRPTITYAPITGQKFNKSFMIPIPPRAILFLTQTGWPVDLVYPLTVDSINGLRSRVAAGSNQRAGDPEFYRVVTLLRQIQKSGAVGMRILKEGAKETTVIFFHSHNIAPDIATALREIRQLLGLSEGQEIEVTYGLQPRHKQEIAMLTRSMLHIMIELATQIDVPPQHVAEGRTVPSLHAPDSIQEAVGRLIHIRHSPDKPPHAFTTVQYKDHWFWIDDRDFKSKRSFAFLMILFSLTETGGKEGFPLVTIPAN